ncbi:MAG TPA: alkaline phosphatase family protein [Actinomycetota bacterium]|nr:alkaline phosphatase family protein [Actinomycetota bacterium]
MRRAYTRVAATTVAVSMIGAHPAPPSAGAVPSPIRHVVIVDLENHSFDDILGKLCVRHSRGNLERAGLDMGCDGARVGVLTNGERRRLRLEPNYGLQISHSVRAQQWAINSGAMDGFSLVPGCRPTDNPAYGCLMQFDPLRGDCGPSGTETCIPNITALAQNFAISDRTFEFRATPSWAAHMVLASATMQRFTGWNPEEPAGGAPGPGWGCDSGRFARWKPPTGGEVLVPSCIPDATGDMGPRWSSYTRRHARYVPTIFDRMETTDVGWRIYSGNYNWAICPTFWECLGSAQRNHLVGVRRIFTDLVDGTLPAVSFVIPPGKRSGHPPGAISSADNWLGHLVSEIMRSEVWSSTAIFITFDDCGCFFDHVNPWAYSRDWGVREPMLIVSPYARAGYTDSRPATFASMLAFIEHTFGLDPLGPCATVDSWDSSCTDDITGPNGQPTYDYADSFDYEQAPLGSVRLVRTPLGAEAREWIARHAEVLEAEL